MRRLADPEQLEQTLLRCLRCSCRAVAEDIRTYFGEAVALYFKFLDFYTIKLLLPLSLVGVLQLALSTLETLPFFCVCNVIAVTVFLEASRALHNVLRTQFLIPSW